MWIWTFALGILAVSESRPLSIVYFFFVYAQSKALRSVVELKHYNVMSVNFYYLFKFGQVEFFKLFATSRTWC